MSDKYLERRVINYYVNMVELLNHNGYHVHDQGTIYCPFHSNQNTPSAKIYRDPNGYKLWCFSEQHMYDVYDCYTILLHMNPHDIFEYLWSRISEQDKLYFTQNQQNYQQDIDWIEPLKKFKSGSINYRQLMIEIEKIINRN